MKHHANILLIVLTALAWGTPTLYADAAPLASGVCRDAAPQAAAGRMASEIAHVPAQRAKGKASKGMKKQPKPKPKAKSNLRSKKAGKAGLGKRAASLKGTKRPSASKTFNKKARPSLSQRARTAVRNTIGRTSARLRTVAAKRGISWHRKGVGGVITKYSRHAVDRAVRRKGKGGLGVHPKAILSAVRNPVRVKYNALHRSYEYRSKGVKVTVNGKGHVTSVMPKSNRAGKKAARVPK